MPASFGKLSRTPQLQRTLQEIAANLRRDEQIEIQPSIEVHHKPEFHRILMRSASFLPFQMEIPGSWGSVFTTEDRIGEADTQM